MKNICRRNETCGLCGEDEDCDKDNNGICRLDNSCGACGVDQDCDKDNVGSGCHGLSDSPVNQSCGYSNSEILIGDERETVLCERQCTNFLAGQDRDVVTD